MTKPLAILLEDVTVREECVEPFLRITKMLFNRRHVLSLGQWDQMFQLPELVAILRSASSAYRDQSTDQSGPIPIELGYLDLRDREVYCVASPWPAEANIELIAAMLREWIEPAGRLVAGDYIIDFAAQARTEAYLQ